MESTTKPPGVGTTVMMRGRPYEVLAVNYVTNKVKLKRLPKEKAADSLREAAARLKRERRRERPGGSSS